MSFFREHDPGLDEEEDHSTAFDRWLDEWILSGPAIAFYVSLIIFGIVTGIFKWIAGALIVMGFILALLGAATIEDIRGS